MSSEEKTEEPTKHKLREARKKGEVAFSKDLAGSVVFISALAVLWSGSRFFEQQTKQILDAALDLSNSKDQSTSWSSAIERMVVGAAWIIVPLLIATLIVGILVSLMQTKGVFSTEPLKLKFEKLNPGESLKQLFSTKQLGVLVQLLFKFSLLSASLVMVFRYALEPLIVGMYGGTLNASAFGMKTIFVLFFCAAAISLFLGIIDYVQQHLEFVKRNKMSKTETKRESKDQNGNPQVKAEQRARRNDTGDRSAKYNVKQANVVVTNPTHFAVALYYEPGEADLPIVVAKGTDREAFEIRTIAEKSGIPVMEYPPLARSLYAKVGVDQYIEEEHLEAVAEVFRWVATVQSRAVSGV